MLALNRPRAINRLPPVIYSWRLANVPMPISRVQCEIARPQMSLRPPPGRASAIPAFVPPHSPRELNEPFHLRARAGIASFALRCRGSARTSNVCVCGVADIAACLCTRFGRGRPLRSHVSGVPGSPVPPGARGGQSIGRSLWLFEWRRNSMQIDTELEACLAKLSHGQFGFHPNCVGNGLRIIHRCELSTEHP